MATSRTENSLTKKFAVMCVINENIAERELRNSADPAGQIGGKRPIGSVA